MLVQELSRGIKVFTKTSRSSPPIWSFFFYLPPLFLRANVLRIEYKATLAGGCSPTSRAISQLSPKSALVEPVTSTVASVRRRLLVAHDWIVIGRLVPFAGLQDQNVAYTSHAGAPSFTHLSNCLPMLPLPENTSCSPWWQVAPVKPLPWPPHPPLSPQACRSVMMLSYSP